MFIQNLVERLFFFRKISEWCHLLYFSIYLAFIVYVGYIFIYTIPRKLGKYVIIGWLINYSDGFTKRGLLGTIISVCCEGKMAPLSIDLLSKSIFILITSFYILQVFKSKANKDVQLVLLLSPVLIFFPMFDRSVIGRAEWFGFLITIFNCYLFKLNFANIQVIFKKSDAVISKVFTTIVLFAPSILLAFMMFVHEGTLLLIAPINIALTFLHVYNVLFKRKFIFSVIFTLIIYIPLFLSFLIILFFGQNGNEHAINICENIKVSHPNIITDPCTDPPGPLHHHAKNVFENILFTLDYIKNYPLTYFFYGLLGTSLTLFSLISVIRLIQDYQLRDDYKNLNIYNEEKYKNRVPIENGYETVTKMILYFFIFPLLSAIPLFIIAIDWGRWFFIINIQFVIVSLLFTNLNTFNEIIIPLPNYDFIKNNLIRFLNSYQKLFPFLIVALLIFKLPVYFGYKCSLNFSCFFSPLVHKIISVLKYAYNFL